MKRCLLVGAAPSTGQGLTCILETQSFDAHGSADDNVHLRNAAEYSEALVQADKQFDMQVYTNRNHGIFGGNTRHHLLTRVSNFFIENLK